MEFATATLEWVDWFNNRRLLSSIENVPPVEFEEGYDAVKTSPATAVGLNQPSLRRTRDGSRSISRRGSPSRDRTYGAGLTGAEAICVVDEGLFLRSRRFPSGTVRSLSPVASETRPTDCPSTLEESSSRWVELLTALRTEHLARLHAFSRQTAFATLGLSAALVLGTVFGLDALWDVSFVDSDLGLSLGLLGALLFLAAWGAIVLGLYQQRRDRSVAIRLLDRAIPQIISGADLRAVLAELSQRMKELASSRYEGDPSPFLPSVLDARWLGTTVYTKVFLGCALLLLAALLTVSALVLAVPPDSQEEDLDGGSPTADAAPGTVLRAGFERMHS